MIRSVSMGISKYIFSSDAFEPLRLASKHLKNPLAAPFRGALPTAHQFSSRCPMSIPGRKDCTYGENCKFGRELHGMDEKVVKTTRV